MTETPKKRSGSSQPKRSARKKYDIPIDPEIEAWSKKLFHPIKPFIEGLKEQAAHKSDYENMSDTDNLSDSDINTDSAYLDTDNFTDTDNLSYIDIMSDTDNLSDSSPIDINTKSSQQQFIDLDHFDQRSGSDRSLRSQVRSNEPKDQPASRSQLRSELEIKSESDFSTFETKTETESDKISDTDIKVESDKISGRLQVPFIKGELRLPNYILKGLISSLSNSEFVVYLWLYFLSYGFGKTACYVSVGKLAESVNLTDRTVFRALNSLETRGLIQRTNRHFLGKAGGLTFEVFLPDTDKLSDTDKTSDSVKMSDEPTPVFRSESDKLSTIKDHDHDLKKMNDHENRTMRMYQDLTANTWTQTDRSQYQQIKDIPIETIESAMKVIANRSAVPIRSFAYFAKSLRKDLTTTSPANTNRAQKIKMQTLIKEIMSAYVGGRVSIADLEEKVRNRYEANGVVFDKKLFNDIISHK